MLDTWTIAGTGVTVPKRDSFAADVAAEIRRLRAIEAAARAMLSATEADAAVIVNDSAVDALRAALAAKEGGSAC